MKKRVAIIGAGISGLTLAQNLKHHADVTVFEKARGVGGRMSTRYADSFYFDHGTQFFTARDKKFQEFLKPLIENGLVADWSGKVINLEAGQKKTKRLWFEPHWVASPNMNSLCKKLAEDLDIRLSVEVTPLADKTSDVWRLCDTKGNPLGEFDWVISTAPPAQTINILQVCLPPSSPLHGVRMLGCYSLMIGFAKPWDKQWIAAKISNSPLEWIAISSSKPNRNSAVTSIVVHSRNDWAEQHIDDDMTETQQFLIEQFETVTGITTAGADYISAHRWKYALVEEAEKLEAFCDAELQVAATGDWLSASRIEDAWRNATRLSADIIHHLQSH